MQVEALHMIGTNGGTAVVAKLSHQGFLSTMDRNEVCWPEESLEEFPGGISKGTLEKIPGRIP